jgi:hypothetical protein
MAAEREERAMNLQVVKRIKNERMLRKKRRES